MPYPKKQETRRDIARRFRTTHITLNKITDEGIDIYDDAALTARLALRPQNPRVIAGTKPRKTKAKKRTTTKTGDGLPEAIKRLEAAETEAHEKYVGMRDQNEPLAPQALKEWTILIKELRDTAKETPNIEKSAANLLEKEAVISAWADRLKPLDQDLDSLAQKIASKGQGMDRHDLETLVNLEVGKIRATAATPLKL